MEAYLRGKREEFKKLYTKTKPYLVAEESFIREHIGIWYRYYGDIATEFLDKCVVYKKGSKLPLYRIRTKYKHYCIEKGSIEGHAVSEMLETLVERFPGATVDEFRNWVHNVALAD